MKNSVEVTTKSEIEVRCEKCGEPLVGTFTARDERLDVEPCETCLEKEYDRGVRETEKEE